MQTRTHSHIAVIVVSVGDLFHFASVVIDSDLGVYSRAAEFALSSDISAQHEDQKSKTTNRLDHNATHGFSRLCLRVWLRVCMQFC